FWRLSLVRYKHVQSLLALVRALHGVAGQPAAWWPRRGRMKIQSGMGFVHRCAVRRVPLAAAAAAASVLGDVARDLEPEAPGQAGGATRGAEQAHAAHAQVAQDLRAYAVAAQVQPLRLRRRGTVAALELRQQLLCAVVA